LINGLWHIGHNQSSSRVSAYMQPSGLADSGDRGMNGAGNLGATGQAGEMAIVDTFTKLIFEEEGALTSGEELIIEAFRLVDHSVALDSYRDMGIYLRALGVAEMIQLVSQVQICLVDGAQAVAGARRETVLDRRAH